MNRKNLWWIAPAVILGNMIILGGLGVITAPFFDDSPWEGAIAGALGWLIIYVSWGFGLNSEKQFLVNERFGIYTKTYLKGPFIRCLPGIIDKTPNKDARGDFLFHPITLYGGTEDDAIDFTDGSAPVKATIWIAVGQKNLNNGNPEDDETYRWTYTVEDSTERVKQIFDGASRPVLQAVSIDQAQKDLQNLSNKIMNGGRTEEEGHPDDEGNPVKRALDEIGAVMDPEKGIILSDIILPEDIKKIRQEALKGSATATKIEREGKGYADAIKAIQKRAKEEGGEDLSFREALALFEYQQGLKTLAETKSNVNLVSHDVQGLLINLGMGGKSDD